MLALRPKRLVTTTILLDGLWGEQFPPSALKILQNHVLRLRKRFAQVDDAPTISTRASGYELLVDPSEVDIGQADRLRSMAHDESVRSHPALAADYLRQAIDLWRGPALEEFIDFPFA